MNDPRWARRSFSSQNFSFILMYFSAVGQTGIPKTNSGTTTQKNDDDDVGRHKDTNIHSFYDFIIQETISLDQ